MIILWTISLKMKHLFFVFFLQVMMLLNYSYKQLMVATVGVIGSRWVHHLTGQGHLIPRPAAGHWHPIHNMRLLKLSWDQNHYIYVFMAAWSCWFSHRKEFKHNVKSLTLVFKCVLFEYLVCGNEGSWCENVWSVESWAFAWKEEAAENKRAAAERLGFIWSDQKPSRPLLSSSSLRWVSSL